MQWEKNRFLSVVFVGTILQIFFLNNTLYGSYKMETIYRNCEKLRPIIEKELNKFSFSQFDVELICALIQVESEFNPRARSISDARGLMQITPIAWKEFINMNGKLVKINERRNVEKNIHMGIWYLHYIFNIMKMYDKKRVIHATLSAYWKGMSKVKQEKAVETIYSRKIKKVYFQLKDQKNKNFWGTKLHLIHIDNFEKELQVSSKLQNFRCLLSISLNESCKKVKHWLAMEISQ